VRESVDDAASDPDGRLNLFSRDTDVLNASQPAAMRLGGITVYAPTEADLTRGINRLSGAIRDAVGLHPSLDRKLLLFVAAKELAERPDRRVFAAVLGRELSLGHMDCVPCASINGKTFRVYIADERIPDFLHRVDEIRTWLRRVRVLTVSEVRKRFFPQIGWGAWSSSAHLLARAAQLGFARQLDKYNFAWPEGL